MTNISSKIEIGDWVMRKSGNLSMQVVRIEGDDLLCRWPVYPDFDENYFHFEDLVQVVNRKTNRYKGPRGIGFGGI
jgi:hypothetical protein